MAYRVTLDGQPVKAKDVKKLQQADFTYRISDETGVRAVGFGSDLEFYGDAYQYLYDQLIADLRNGKNKKISIKIYDDCCDNYLMFDGYIDAGSLDWCAGECFVTVGVTEKDTDYGCLLNVLITDNFNGFQSRDHLFFRYCTETRPNLTHELFLVMAMLLVITIVLTLKPLALTLELIIGVINIILSIISFLGGTPGALEIKFSLNNIVNQLISTVQNFAVGCSSGHPAFLVRELVSNACEKCGLSFESPIFTNSNSPYYNTVLLSAPTKEGTENPVTYIVENDPNINCLRFLDQLKDVFNADYRIKNGVLTFDQKFNLGDNSVYFDATNFNHPDIIEKPCFSFTADDRPRYAVFKYPKDGRDWVGDEAENLYNEIVDFDPSQTDARLSGNKEYILNFSTARFRRDGIERDVLSEYAEIPIVGNELLSIKDRDNNNLLLGQGVCLKPKLLIWDGVSDRDNAKVIRKPRFQGSKDFHYNWWYWFCAAGNKPELNKVYFPNENLYDLFYVGDEPNNPNNPFVGWDFTMTIKKTCDYVKQIDFDKRIAMRIGMIDYKAKIKEITVRQFTIVIKGMI